MKKPITSVEDLLSLPSFRRWAKGTASQKEAENWDKWCRQQEVNRRFAKNAQAEILGIKPLEDKSLDNAEDSWNLFLKDLPDKHHRLNAYRQVRPIVWGYRTAVIFLVIAITAFIAYEINSGITDEATEEVVLKEISTDYGEQKTLSLTDGSHITLNANSSLVYPESWKPNSKVEVELQGEAYFSISTEDFTDESQFIVSTPDGIVQVTGTCFVVETDNERTQVVLEEGSVNIAKTNTGDNSGEEEQEFVELAPNQLASYSRFNDDTTIKRVNTSVYTSWRNKELILDSTPLEVVTDRISKAYGVEVRISDERLLNRKLTGTINLKSLDHVLSSLSDVLEMEINKSGHTVFLNNNPK